MILRLALARLLCALAAPPLVLGLLILCVAKGVAPADWELGDILDPSPAPVPCRPLSR